MTADTVDVAISLARIGWYVFPWNDALGKGHVQWTAEATTDAATIRHWWKRWPNARLGVHAGMSGLVGVDLDVKNGKDGVARVAEAGLPLPSTLSYNSRSGKGQHHVYRAPKGEQLTIATNLKLADGTRLDGVDIRSGNGVIFYNGPILDKKPSLAPAPEWAIVHKGDTDYDTADVEAWLEAERSPEPRHETRHLVRKVPLQGKSNPDLLTLLTPIVRSLKYGYGRRQAYDMARERWSREYPEHRTQYGIAFDRAFGKAISRMEHDWQKQSESVESEESDERVESDSVWTNVADIRRGGAERAKATVLKRDDGQHLFYKAKVNTLMGDPESGKTLIAAVGAAEVLSSGGRVAWFDLDHNSTPDIVAMLEGFGVEGSLLDDTSRFRIASEKLEDKDDVFRAVADLADWAPDYVILDSVGELVPLLEGNSNDADDYTVVNRAVASKLANGGACVVIIDHMAKGSDSRKFGAGGTMAKKRAGNGAQLEVIVKRTFDLKHGGRSDVKIVKDRPSDVRSNSPKAEGTQRARAAIFEVFPQDAEGKSRYELRYPDDEATKPHRGPTKELKADFAGTPTDRVSADVALLKTLKEPPKSKRDVMARMKWGSVRALKALGQYQAEMAAEKESADA